MDGLAYWRARYASGGTSGAGSRGAEAAAKARLLDGILAEFPRLPRVLDLGCGDGYVRSLVVAPMAYVGVDPARGQTTIPPGGFDLVLSFDVLHHLVEEAAYRAYLAQLFRGSAEVLVWGTDHDERGAAHVRHRRWTPDVPPGWTLRASAPTGFGRKQWWRFARVLGAGA